MATSRNGLARAGAISATAIRGLPGGTSRMVFGVHPNDGHREANGISPRPSRVAICGPPPTAGAVDGP